MSNEVSGGCLCGAVTFKARLPSKWCAHCHCSMCRKFHGAGYVTFFGMQENQVELDNSGGQLRWHESSPGSERGFCNHCGSSMFFKSERWAGELHIALAAVDGAIDRAPQAHVFYDTHIDWLPIDDALEIIRS